MSIEIQADGATLQGDLLVPSSLKGAVLFAHGSGSSRHSPRNQMVARSLYQTGMATLLLDLITGDEPQLDERTGQFRFHIDMLAKRLVAAASWLACQREFDRVKLGVFGASTGAAAALVAAAESAEVAAVVSRGGRPDLAGQALEHVRAPVLLIVGSEDREVLELNRQAMARMRCESKLEIVPGATHLFDEPGTLEQVAQLARSWFERHLGPRPRTL